MKTKPAVLVNLKTFKGEGVVKIDRSTIFGNPFHITGSRTREQSIAEYRTYFYKRLKEDLFFKSKVSELRGRVLGCWCKPLSCHGEVILEYLNSLDTK